jgi:hypothetical protein
LIRCNPHWMDLQLVWFGPFARHLWFLVSFYIGFWFDSIFVTKFRHKPSNFSMPALPFAFRQGNISSTFSPRRQTEKVIHRTNVRKKKMLIQNPSRKNYDQPWEKHNNYA